METSSFVVAILTIVAFIKKTFSKTKTEDPQQKDGSPNAWDMRQYLIDFASSARQINLLCHRIRQPFGYTVGVLSNLLTVDDYMIENRILKEDQDQIGASCRDIKVVLGRFDRLIASHMQNKIDSGEVNIYDQTQTKNTVEKMLLELDIEGMPQWLTDGQIVVRKHLEVLSGETVGGGKKAHLVHFLVNEALNAGPIGYIVGLSDDLLDEDDDDDDGLTDGDNKIAGY